MPSETPWNYGKELLSRAQRGEFDSAGDEEKARAVSEHIRSCGSAAAMLALQPFTGVDSVLVTPLHCRMVMAIARIRGHVVDARGIYADIFKPLRNRIIVKHLAMTGAKFAPFLNLLAVPVAYGLTCALGGVSAEYYRRGRTMGDREMNACFDTIYRKAHEREYKQRLNELRAMFQNPATRRRIDELKKAQGQGTTKDEEIERRIDAMLSQR